MKQSIIYKIICKDPTITDCYVGRTASFGPRVNQHKTCCSNQNSNNYKYKLYEKIRENGGWDNWDVKQIETIDHDCFDTSAAREREAFWFHELKPTLNNNTPNQSHKESCKIWFKKNPTYFHDYSVEYYAKNKESIQERQKAYYAENKERMNATCKAWVENNRERNRKYQMDRYYKIKAQKLAAQEKLNIV
jgi:hypothetical protein